MTIYIALLRGINVGGHNKIKMSELKAMCEALGLAQVQTYIQSGNVLFASDEQPAQLRARIENAIQSTFGFRISVILRTQAEFESILARLPFSEEEIQAATGPLGKEVLYVTLLDEAPKPEAVDKLGTYEKDKYAIDGLSVYLLFDQTILDSKLAANLQKLGVTMTMRNWKTMTKLASLAKEM
ncbi:DUF1697 domain-containing protein [Cohnella suwonensis]|uniref:DUF1697 domain-containing protein n=1 Tax=Cohnella suwonensis TaxID=696072 RepID=A0ABW0LWG4_9BACL